jgi:glycosyltransferase involved in cell wall biosynthesis
MKNLLILPRWYPNKTDIQLGIFIQRQLLLMQTEFNCHVIYVQPISDAQTKFELVTTVNGQLTEHLVYVKSSKGVFRKLINFIRFYKAQKLAFRQIKDTIDLVQIHVPYRTAMLALKLKREKKINFVITEHWSGHLNGLYLQKNLVDRFLYKKVLKKASKISTVSQPLNIAFKKNTGFESVVIPNFIERADSQIQQDSSTQINILSVSDLDDKTKNITGLLTAFHEAFQINPNLHLTIIGGGPDEDKIKTHLQKLNLPAQAITLKGRQAHKEVLRAMATCDFYICNSRYETFGMTVAEALYAGKPVICTRCGGPETFLSPENSLQISPASKTPTQSEIEELKNATLTMASTHSTYNSTELTNQIELKYGKKAVKAAWMKFYNT